MCFLFFANKQASWTGNPSSVTFDSFQKIGLPQISHLIAGSSMYMGEETSNGIRTASLVEDNDCQRQQLTVLLPRLRCHAPRCATLTRFLVLSLLYG